MRTYTLLALLMATFTFFGGCKKKDDPSKKDLLTAHEWKVTAWTSDPALVINGNNYGNDIYSQIAINPTCVKDNLYFFDKNGNYRQEEGVSKCADTDPATYESGTWTLNSDDKTLQVIATTSKTQQKSTTEYTITDINSSKMTATWIFLSNNISYKQTMTFTKP